MYQICSKKERITLNLSSLLNHQQSFLFRMFVIAPIPWPSFPFGIVHCLPMTEYIHWIIHFLEILTTVPLFPYNTKWTNELSMTSWLNAILTTSNILLLALLYLDHHLSPCISNGSIMYSSLTNTTIISIYISAHHLYSAPTTPLRTLDSQLC